MADETILHQDDVEAVIADQYDMLSDPLTATTTQLVAIGSVVNTVDKHAGKMIFNTTTGAPCWAVGSTAGALWVTSAGATAHTPA
jgi:hypothetical protein